jgi:PASTA domain
MANPLDSLKDLKGWQKGAVIGGGVLAVVVVYEYKKKATAKAATPATATPAATSAPVGTSTAGEIEDPTTGQYYPDTSADPDTGLTYEQEITEYGSVAAADQEYAGANDQAALQGETPQEYVEQTGGYTGESSAAAPVTTNAQWMAEVESGLSEQGYTAGDIGQGIAGYFASKPLGTTTDGTNLYTMMNLAVSEYGPPPTGSYALLNGGGASTLPGTGNPVPGNVTVPNVVGKPIDQAGPEITAAGLKWDGPGPVKGKVVTVTSTIPAAGASVAKGTTIRATGKTS